jgi:hypothetical protein
MERRDQVLIGFVFVGNGFIGLGYQVMVDKGPFE